VCLARCPSRLSHLRAVGEAEAAGFRSSTSGETVNQTTDGVGGRTRRDQLIGTTDSGMARSGRRAGRGGPSTRSGRDALVMMVQAAEVRDLDDPTPIDGMDLARAVTGSLGRASERGGESHP